MVCFLAGPVELQNRWPSSLDLAVSITSWEKAGAEGSFLVTWKTRFACAAVDSDSSGSTDGPGVGLWTSPSMLVSAFSGNLDTLCRIHETFSYFGFLKSCRVLSEFKWQLPGLDASLEHSLCVPCVYERTAFTKSHWGENCESGSVFYHKMFQAIHWS